MSTDILISSDPWENRVAILEDGTLSEIYVEREEKVIGSIYKGKVQNVLPGMGAAFVDIGLGRNAFLYVDDINKTPLNIGDVEITSGRSGFTINEKVNRGDDVLVQIVKEPRGLKGARISTNISLTGRFIVLMPTGRFSGVSRKIESAEERNRLKAVMKAMRPEGMATVIRTAADRASAAELVADLGVLIRMWHGILENYKRASAPALLHKDMNLVFKAARDFITSDVENVYIDDADEAESVRDMMRLLGPQYLERIKTYSGGHALFRDYKIDDEIARLMRPTVKLPSGGSLVIETTEAMTVIDVNSGKFTGGRNLDDTIVRTNVEAATEIARQVRLRDIGGMIVCDFIDMATDADRDRVKNALEAGLRKDRTRSTIHSFTALGLLEFTRKRIGKDLGGQLRSACPTCRGIGNVLSPETVTIATLREIAGHAGVSAQHVHVVASPEVAAQAEFWYEDELKSLGEQLGKPIDVRVDPAAHPERPRVLFNGALPELPPVRVGDEFDVELLDVRTPEGKSALAVVNGRLIEVEGAANHAGNPMKIRIIDVDGEEILAEPRASVGAPPAAAGDGKRRRRRGGRGRSKPISPAEEIEELRELAEEAAQTVSARPPIGISTEPEDDKPAIPSVPAAAVAPAPAARTERTGRPDRTERGRGPRPSEARPAASAAPPAAGASGPAVVVLPGESLSGALVLPGESLSGDRIGGGAPPPRPAPVPFERPERRPDFGDRRERRPAVVEPEPADAGASAADVPSNVIPFAEPTGDGTRRRRRRRRRGRGNGAEPIPLGASPVAGLTPADPTADADDDVDESGLAAATPEGDAESTDPQRRRRRRRRRGRGGAGAADTAASAAAPPVPDRHIFRVATDGSAHPTGEVAPKEPSRAIAHRDDRPAHVAVEPPPPSISAPDERPDVKVTTPARRRRGPAAAAPPTPPAPIEATPRSALPAPADAPDEAPLRAARATRRRTPTDAVPDAPAPVAVAAPAPKAVAARKRTVSAAKAPPAKKTASTAKKAAPTKATAAKKSASTAKKSAPAKATAAKKTASTAKKAAPRKAAAKKTATTTRKKR